LKFWKKVDQSKISLDLYPKVRSSIVPQFVGGENFQFFWIFNSDLILLMFTHARTYRTNRTASIRDLCWKI